MVELYSFKALENFLDKRSFPKLQSQKIEVVRGNVLENIKEEKVEFRKDGTYIIHNNQWQKVFMFIKNPTIKRATKYNPRKSLREKLPKFHLIECQTIRNNDFIGHFDSRFDFSNNKTVDLEDFDEPSIKYNNQVLEICTYCKREIQEQIDYKTTEGFFELLDIEDERTNFENVEVDINGYTLDWRQRSDRFRIENNWICDKCKLNLSDDIMYRRFLEVHHRDRNKENNTRENLQCLCIYCHTTLDELHIENYKKSKPRQIQMKTFLSKYGDYLKKFYKRDNL